MTITLYELGGKDGVRHCPFCWRTLMALHHKGFDDFLRVPVYYRDRTPIAFSRQKRVPVLVDGDRWINDSWEIADYLESTYPDRPTLFGSEIGRAQAEFVSAWIQGIRKPGLTEILLWDAFEHIDPEDRAWWRADREPRFGRLEDFRHGRDERTLAWRERLAPLRLVLSQKPFLAGPVPAYADYIVFGDFQWARCISTAELVPSDDPIYAWRERMLDLFDGIARRAPNEA